MPCRIDTVWLVKNFGAAACIFIALNCCITSHARDASPGTSIVPGPDRVSDFQARLALARLLSYRENFIQKALLHYQGLLAQQGQNTAVRLEYGRALLRGRRYAEAIAQSRIIMNEILFSNDPDVLREAAFLEAALGHAANCRDLFLKALSMRDAPAGLNLQFADLMHMWGDFYEIERIYRERLKRRPDDAGVQLKMAGLLGSSQRYEEAEGLYRRLMQSGFPREKLYLELARLKLEEKAFAEARGFLDRFFTLMPKAHMAGTPALKAEQTGDGNYGQWYREARFLNADIFFHQKQYDKAYAAYQDCLSQLTGEATPDEATPDKIRAFIGMGRSALNLNDPLNARAAFHRAHDLDPNHIEAGFYYYLNDGAPDDGPGVFAGNTGDPGPANPADLVQWGRLFASRGRNTRAVSCYEAALKKDPENFPAKLALAEVLGTDRQYGRAKALFRELLDRFPANYRVTLGLARVQAWSREYDAAVSTYETLLSVQPQHPVVLIELARTKCWAKNMDGAFETYARLYSPPVDQTLLERLNGLSRGAADAVFHNRLGKLKEMVSEASVYEGYEFFFREPFSEAGRSADPGLEALRIELLPAYRIQKTARLEQKAKYEAYHQRFLSARHTLSTLTAHQPGNREALFDKAQADCALGLCDREAESYQTLLDLDPLHSLARAALERNRIRYRPLIRTDYRYSREQGRGDLSQIEHQRFDLRLELPVSCRYRFRFTGQKWLESPLGGYGSYEMDGHTLELSGALSPELKGMLRWTKKYDDDAGVGGTDTGAAHLWLNVKDDAKIGMGFDRRDVFDNDFAIRQETQADAWWIGVTANPDRHLEIGARAETLSYSDGNDGKTGELTLGYAFTDHPKVFKTILAAEYRDTRHGNGFQYRGGDLADIVHPYWTPDDYWAAGVSLAWYHDLSKRFFCGSQQHYYELVLSLGQDADRNPSIELKLKWHFEFTRHWMVDVEGLVHRSSEWDANGVQAAVHYQF